MATKNDELALELPQVSPRPRAELWESVLDTLRRAIVSGKLPVGTRLVEADLAGMLQVSRWPVRQAITRLEQEGLVVRYPNRGAYVVEFTEDDIREVCELRGLLEAYAAREAAKRLSPEDEERLRLRVDELRRYVDANDPVGAAKPDIEFHRTIFHIAGSKRLLHMWEILVAPTYALMAIRNMSENPDAFCHAPDAHELIIDALRSGDPEQAERVTRRRLDVAERRLLERYASSNDGE